MTSATDILRRLEAVGARVECRAGRLVVQAGRRPVPMRLVEAARAAKNELSKMLKTTEDAPKEKMSIFESNEHLRVAASPKMLNSSEDAHVWNSSAFAEHEHVRGASASTTAVEVDSLPATAQPWDAEDWRIYFQERAAIREYDANVSREIAERRAWRETANRWWFELGTRFPANVCAGCERPVSTSDGIPLLYDQRVHDADCVIRFGRRWISEAAVALAAMGIPAPNGIMPEDAP
jgi:hypothetical protein